eukprot:554660_1
MTHSDGFYEILMLKLNWLSTHILFLCCVSVTSSTIDYGAWYESQVSMPRANDQMAIAHDTNNSIIWLVSGKSNKQQLVSFNYHHFNFTDYGLYYLNSSGLITASAGVGQYYTQINNILWMIDAHGTSFNIFDIATNIFKHNYSSIVFPQNVHSSSCLASIDNNYLVVNGGQNEVGYYLNTVQILNISSFEWITNVPNLNIARGYHSCIVHHKSEKMYVMGGYDYFANGDTYQDSIEVLDVSDMSNIQHKSWMNIGNLLTRMLGHRSVIYKDDILVFGGRSRYRYEGTINVINTLTNAVSNGGHLGFTANYMSPIVVYPFMFVFGGNYNMPLNYWKYNILPTISPTSSPITPPTSNPSFVPSINSTVIPSINPTVIQL